MWFFEALGLVILAGAALGVAWRFTEDYFEKRTDRRREALEAELNKQENTVSNSKAN